MASHCPRCAAPLDEPNGPCATCALRDAVSADTAHSSEGSCRSCGSPLDWGARFCPRCGASRPAVAEPSGDPVREALEGQLGGQYRILRLLGRGGMGAVYLARDLTLEREVAIKVVTPSSNAAMMYDRFRREAKTAARLSHPYIVPLHAFGNIGGMPYFVMGFVRGESLADRMRREGRLPEGEVRRILVEIADALDHAHREGVVHRDVKPDNVLLEDATGRALLTDFGIAKSMDPAGGTLTQHGTVVGTPHYMSPEQAAGRAEIDGRSDLYSLGVMGYAMITGRLPFEGASAAEILSKHLTQEPPSVRSLSPLVSDGTQQAIERCLEKDRAKRWPDARSFRASLGASEETGLPDALESLQGQGIAFAAIGAALLLVMWLVVVRMQNAPIAVLGIVGAVLAFGYVVVVGRLRFEGFSIGLTQRVIWSEPGWWPYWYPRPLRRAQNVWDRLPGSVRAFRMMLPAAALVFVWLALTAQDLTPNFAGKLVFLVILVMIVMEFKVKRDLKRMGVRSRNDLNRIAYSAPPSRARFWTQPQIVAVLVPKQTTGGARSDSPNDLLREILRIGDELSGPLRALGSEAAVAARRLIGSIDHSEKQIADLARNLDPGEEQRLAEKISLLAGEEAEPMRELLQRQLDLIRGIEARIEVAKADRSRHLEMLKTLALHMASLRSRAVDAPSRVGSLSDDVRALCDQIGGHLPPSAAQEPTAPQGQVGP